MTSTEQERWARVKERLRAEVGEDIYSSWFARMELEGIEEDTVKLSVPTRFLKSWIQSHYTEQVLACWQAEQPSILRIELTVRSAVIRTLPPKSKPAETASELAGHRTQTARDYKSNGGEPRSPLAPVSAVHEALGGSPLDPRLYLRDLRGRPLQHARPRRRQAGGARPPRRRGHVQSALHPRRRRSRQDPSPAGDRLGRQQQPRAQGALSHRREIHVRLRRRAAHADRARLQGGAARHRRAGDRRPAVPAGQSRPRPSSATPSTR